MKAHQVVIMMALLFMAGTVLLTGCAPQPGTVTLQNYEKLKFGMSYDAVVAILGKPQQTNPFMGIQQCPGSAASVTSTPNSCSIAPCIIPVKACNKIRRAQPINPLAADGTAYKETVRKATPSPSQHSPQTPAHRIGLRGPLFYLQRNQYHLGYR